MSQEICTICRGTGKDLLGNPCPDCAGKVQRMQYIKRSGNIQIPEQYQGILFDKTFLPKECQGQYGDLLEQLKTQITRDYNMFCKNYLIISPMNSGKSIWAYNILSMLANNGHSVLPIMDLFEVREYLQYKGDNADVLQKILKSKGLFVRIPGDVQYWAFDIMQTILEQRVKNNGFTIFLYNGTLERLEDVDKYKTFHSMRGDGTFHSIKLEGIFNDRI